MEAIKQNIYVPGNHRVHFDLKVPESISTGETEVLLVFQPKQKSHKQPKKRTLGLYKNKGSFKLKPDFEMTEEELLGI